MSTNITQNNYFFLIFTVFFWQFLRRLLKFYHVFLQTTLFFFFSKIFSVSIKLQLKFSQIFILVYLIFFQIPNMFLIFFFQLSRLGYQTEQKKCQGGERSNWQQTGLHKTTLLH